MDSGRKRKAANDQPSTGTVTKKIRLVNSNAAASPAQTDVQRVGQKLLAQLDRATDKTGRNIVTLFKALPSKEELPDYYNVIRLPVAIEMIDKKLQDDAYPTVTTLESDLKRMVQNAKDYNQAGSLAYEDAERIRKLVYNFMKSNNPEYNSNPDYVSFPTPLPEGESVSNGASAPLTNGVDKKRRRSSAPPVRDMSEGKSPITSVERKVQPAIQEDYTGKTFQQAQELIISSLLRHTDKSGLEIYTPFATLPSRKLEDYYKTIRYPVSLKGVAKRIKGIHGRNEATGVTDYKSWEAFHDDVSWIWRNAQNYNEDGSDMYSLAAEFKSDFLKRFELAKSKVEGPDKLKLKLTATKPKVTLNLSQHRASPGVAVDNDALLRQKQLVTAGMQGNEIRGSPAINGVGDGRPQSSHTGSDHGTVKLEKGVTQSPAPMPSNGFVPHGIGEAPMLLNGHSSYTFTAPAALPPTPIRPYNIADALLPSVTLASHPQLKLDAPFSVTVGPHDTLSQQSYTFTLPNTYYQFQISPTISKDLSMGRPYKMFVTVNGNRLTQRDTVFHQDSGKRTHVYEGALAQGVNRIEVEVAAAKNGEEKGLDIEKLTVYANIMKP